MQTHADRVVAEILQAEDPFLIEVGRLTLLFSRIEECLVSDARLLASLSEDEELRNEAAAPALLYLRVLEKRDFLKRAYADVARCYNVDHSRLSSVLDELGNINRLRRTIVHGWIRWSEIEQGPVLVDIRGQSVPAWPQEILDINMKVVDWHRNYYEAQRAVMEAVMDTYKGLAERLAAHPNLPPVLMELIAHIMAKAGETDQP